MLRHALPLTASIALLSLAACGGGDGGDDRAPDQGGSPAARACPPQADQALKEAAFAMKSDDFDAALAAIKPYLGCPKVERREAGYRSTAASTTLKIARRRLADA